MKGMKALLTAIVFAAAFAMAAPAAAQFYIGATIGQAEFKEGCLGTGECDDQDTAWRILGGFQFSKFFALELVAVASLHLTERFSVYRQGRRLSGHS